MLTRLRIKDFQSHKHTDLNLGQFTVIVGPSSSGKSSVVRALSLLARNARGTSYVRHGASFTRVEISTEQSSVVVERGSNRSIYELTTDEDTIKFTKCSTSVPETVESSLDFGTDETWIAGQFDRPFLLAETGSNVARQLSELTNVNMIFAAVRELNRRAGYYKQLYGASTQELEATRVKLLEFEDLPVQLDSCSNAELALQRAEQLAARRSVLAGHVSSLQGSYGRLRGAQADIRPVPDIALLVQLIELRSRLSAAIDGVLVAQRRLAAVSTVEVPDISTITSLTQRRQTFASLVSEGCQAVARRQEALDWADHLASSVVAESESLASLLSEAGMCPVCGAAAEHARFDHVSV